MKFGLKLWSTNQNVISQAEQLINENVFQYIELTPIPNTQIDAFLSYNLPYTIHITTENYGVNIADKEKQAYNFNVINNCIEWADQLKAKYLILHPGFGSFTSAIEFLEYIEDKRILIENMPKVGLKEEKMIGYSPDQISELIGTKYGFCFDFNHAIKAALSLKTDYKEYIKKFLILNPSYFHIADGKLNNDKDEHLNIGEGQYDFDFLGKYIFSKTINCLTLETPRKCPKSLKEDKENLERIQWFNYK